METVLIGVGFGVIVACCIAGVVLLALLLSRYRQTVEFMQNRADSAVEHALSKVPVAIAEGFRKIYGTEDGRDDVQKLLERKRELYARRETMREAEDAATRRDW